MTDKFAKFIDGLSDEEIAFSSLKTGLTKAMSEFGLTPKQANEILEKTAAINVPELLKKYTIAMALTGGAVGMGTAALRHKIENTAKGSETPQMRNTKARVDAYKRMITNFREEEGLQNERDQIASGNV